MSLRHLLAVIPVALSAVSPGYAAQPPPGEHAAAGRTVASQQERDWVDNRWSRTDVGQFLASNLDVPGGKIAKGLSIKVGEHDEGAVGYDTASCTLRAGWLGGFLKFDPGRFGLIVAPKIAGEVAFSLPSDATWSGGDVRFGGLYPRGQRVVLEYTVGEMRVLDSPWLETVNGLRVFMRFLELGPCAQETRMVVAALSLGETILAGGPTSAQATLINGSNAFAVGIHGSGVTFQKEKSFLVAAVPAHESILRLKFLLWTGSADKLKAFDQAFRIGGADHDLETLVSRLASPRWLPELKTVGQRGLNSDILAVDTLAVPYHNPWKALMFLAGVDFTPDGAAYVCTIHGDVWRVTGVDDPLRELMWKRFATGLFQPLGLKVRDGQVFVLGRDQITRLHDRNADGEADFYENFSNLIATSIGGHDYVTSLEKDDAGNFYYVDPKGVHHISADGRQKRTLATGFRNPNALGVSPDGRVITAAPQQGEWTPSSEICEIKLDGYYGYGGPKITLERPLGYDAPLCWIPHSVDNSSGSQVWIPSNHWGALGGQMLHLLWGRCGLMLVLRDVVDGTSQGAVVPLPGRFLSGPNRGSFNPKDGHLYVAGSTGWQTSAAKDGALHRVRFTDKPIYVPMAWRAHRNGLSITFTQPLDRGAAEDVGSYAVQQWNYRYAAQYGSKDWSVTHPDKEGRDEVAVRSARLLSDRKTVFLEIPGLAPVMQMEVKYSLNAADGKPMRNQFWLTLNKLAATQDGTVRSAER
jgi:hypothetical protein